MSNKLLNRTWDVHDLTPCQKLVLLAMSDLARDESDNTCFASHETMLEMTGVSRRHFITTVADLVRLGHITEQELKGRTVRHGCRFSYRVHPLTGATTAPVTGAMASADRCDGFRRQVRFGAPTGAMASAPNICTPSTPSTPKGNQSPLPSQLPELIKNQKKLIISSGETHPNLEAFISKLAEYETQLYGAPKTAIAQLLGSTKSPRREGVPFAEVPVEVVKGYINQMRAAVNGDNPNDRNAGTYNADTTTDGIKRKIRGVA